MKDVLIGIDIGTSACKVAAFDECGRVLATADEGYKVFYNNPGWAEQNPMDWWQAVCVALKKITKVVEPERIAGVGIDGQSWSAIPIDTKGRVLANTPIWMDTRAADICKKIINKHGENTFFAVSGNPLKPSYTLPKILWYKENSKDVYSKIHKILQSNSFIAFMLTGAITQDKSQGYGLACYDINKSAWNTKICELLGIDQGILPDICDSHSIVGVVTKKAAEQTGLLYGTPVVAGGLDAACGTLGAGVINVGQTQEQGGQAGGMSICLEQPTADERLILGNHVVPKHWLLQGGTVGGGGALNWFMKEFGADERKEAVITGKSCFALMDEQVDKIPQGSDGLIFLPYMAGERSPIWEPKAKGVFYGADFAKTKAHFARAVMEGVAYSLRHNLETAKKAGAAVGVLRSMGGAANSRVWTQLKADICGKEIEVPKSDTATALGAAILAGVGTGFFENFEKAINQTVKIKHSYSPKASPKYEDGYENYIKLYKSVKNMWEVD